MERDPSCLSGYRDFVYNKEDDDNDHDLEYMR